MALGARIFAPGAPLARSDVFAGIVVAGAICGATGSTLGMPLTVWPAVATGAAVAASVGLFRARALGRALATHGQEAVARARQSEARYRLLAENAGDVIVLVRADRTRAYVSPAARAVFGCGPDALIKRDFAEWLHPEDRARVQADYDTFCRHGGRVVHSYRLRHEEGHYVWVESTWVTTPSAGDSGANDVIAIVRDVSERRQAEERIAFLSRHDPLTGLPNRTVLRERVEEALRRIGRGGALALLALDLDDFQAINDQLGHAAGDALLRAAAERLAGAMRETDVIVRLEGDSFGVLQSGVERPEDAGKLAERLLGVLAAPFPVGTRSVALIASVGIAIAPADGNAFETLLLKSEAALERCKHDGRGSWRYFEARMEARRGMVQALTLDLRKALAAGQFVLHYQALVALKDRRITGFEALLRWRHPTRDLVSPAEFIPIAEETGLIVPIGAWVLRQACMEAARWPPDITVAVNLSPVQLRSPALTGTVRAALTMSGLPAHRLELEITESVLLGDDDTRTLASLKELRAMGVRISMDDFGTGYSSLRYLRSFPFDKIKLDQSFVRDLSGGPEAMVIVRAVAGLGHSLGIATLAEGVETSEQLDRLRAAGYTEAQGYLFNRPGPSYTVASLLAANRAGAPAETDTVS